MFKTLVSLLFFTSFLTVTQGDIDQANSELDSKLNQIESIQVQIDDVYVVQETTNQEISALQTEVDSVNSQIASKENDIILTENKINDQTQVSLSMLVAMQHIEANNLLIRNILNSDSDQNIINRIYNNQRLVDMTLSEILKTIGLKNEMEVQKSELDALNDSLAVDLASLAQKQRDLAAQEIQLNQLLVDSNASADSLKAEIAQMEYDLAFQNVNANVVDGDKASLMASVGIASSDYQYVDYIISHESSWNYTATNPYSGAYGLCQALPGEKMASAGSDWKTNPQTQMRWCDSYAQARYGSWGGAYNFWVANHWW